MAQYDNDPPFQSMVRASGLAEVWTHSTDAVKFYQFGWRCTNKETSYGNKSLVGNWNEERFDNQISKQAKPLPSQNNHYFESSYDKSYNKQPYEVPKELKHLKAPHPNAFPAHQPETDSAALKSIYNSWETTTRAGYVDPRIREQPLNPQSNSVATPSS